MQRLLPNRLRSLTGLERAVYGLVALLGVLAVFLLLRAGDGDSGAASPQPTPVSPVAQQPEPEPEAPAAERRCADLRIPAMPPEPVTCRSATSTLTIAAQDDPVLLGTTHVRVMSAYAGGRTLVVKARVRNETAAEQSVLAGGQELYVNVAGRRLDAQQPGDVVVAPGSAATVVLRFPLGGSLRALRRGDGRAELGIRPWTDGAGGPRPVVGVARFRATLSGGG